MHVVIAWTVASLYGRNEARQSGVTSCEHVDASSFWQRVTTAADGENDDARDVWQSSAALSLSVSAQSTATMQDVRIGHVVGPVENDVAAVWWAGFVHRRAVRDARGHAHRAAVDHRRAGGGTAAGLRAERHDARVTCRGTAPGVGAGARPAVTRLRRPSVDRATGCVARGHGGAIGTRSRLPAVYARDRRRAVGARLVAGVIAAAGTARTDVVRARGARARTGGRSESEGHDEGCGTTEHHEDSKHGLYQPGYCAFTAVFSWSPN